MLSLAVTQWEQRASTVRTDPVCDSRLMSRTVLTITGVLVPASGPARSSKGEVVGVLGQAEGCVNYGVGKLEQSQV